MALMGRCKPGVWPPYTARAKNRGCFAIPTWSLYAHMPRPALVSRQQSAWARSGQQCARDVLAGWHAWPLLRALLWPRG